MRPISGKVERGARERAVSALAAQQHGVLTREQLLGLGASPEAIKRWLRAGRLHPLHRGVYLLGHSVLPPLAREMAAVLACGPHALLESHKRGVPVETASPTRQFRPRHRHRRRQDREQTGHQRLPSRPHRPPGAPHPQADPAHKPRENAPGPGGRSAADRARADGYRGQAPKPRPRLSAARRPRAPPSARSPRRMSTSAPTSSTSTGVSSGWWSRSTASAPTPAGRRLRATAAATPSSWPMAFAQPESPGSTSATNPTGRLPPRTLPLGAGVDLPSVSLACGWPPPPRQRPRTEAGLSRRR